MSAGGGGKTPRKPRAVQTEAALCCSCLVPQKHTNNCGGKEALGCSPPSGRAAAFTSPALHLAPLSPTHLHQGFGGAPCAALHGRPLTFPASEQGLFSEHRQHTAFICCSSPDDSSPCPPCATRCLFPLSILIWAQLRDLAHTHC